VGKYHVREMLWKLYATFKLKRWIRKYINLSVPLFIKIIYVLVLKTVKSTIIHVTTAYNCSKTVLSDG
jgi:hypothetical protein